MIERKAWFPNRKYRNIYQGFQILTYKMFTVKPD